MAKPQPGESAAFYHKYIALADGESVSEIVDKYAFDLQEFYKSIPDEKADFAYAENKWTIKEVLQHITDAERVFAYLCCVFAGMIKHRLHLLMRTPLWKMALPEKEAYRP